MKKLFVLLSTVLLIQSCTTKGKSQNVGFDEFCKEARLLIANGGYSEQIDKTIASGAQLNIELAGKPEAAIIKTLLDSLSGKQQDAHSSLSTSGIIITDNAILLAEPNVSKPFPGNIKLTIGDCYIAKDKKTDSSGQHFLWIAPESEQDSSPKGWVKASDMYTFDNYTFDTYKYSTWPEANLTSDTPVVFTGAFYNKLRKNQSSTVKYILPATLKADLAIFIDSETSLFNRPDGDSSSFTICGTPMRVLDTTADRKFIRVVHWDDTDGWVRMSSVCLLSDTEWELYNSQGEGYKDIKGRYTDPDILFNEEFLERAANSFGNCFYTIHEALFGSTQAN